jgi:hypothetical protein
VWRIARLAGDFCDVPEMLSAKMKRSPGNNGDQVEQYFETSRFGYLLAYI